MKYLHLLFVLCCCAALTSCWLLNTPHDSPVGNAEFPISMAEVLGSEANKSFVKQSVKTESVARSAFYTLTDDDKKQGYPYSGSNWNVPSNVYGTSTTPADNTLIVNGEDLGTLQDLYFHKNAKGQYDKAMFTYKGYVYYVLDKGNFFSTEAEQKANSYVVLSTEDSYNLDKIYLDQRYLPSSCSASEYSSWFKFWVWDRDGHKTVYRAGNLGIAFTIRNFPMQDGSTATVTVSGYNYLNYGFRVWIKDTTGTTTVKNEYPAYAESNDLNKSYPYSLKSDVTLSNHECNRSDADIGFKIINNTGVTILAGNYILYLNTIDPNRQVASISDVAENSENYEIANDTSKTIYYKFSQLSAYGNNLGIGIGAVDKTNFQMYSSAEYKYIRPVNQGKLFTVTVTKSTENGLQFTFANTATNLR